LAFIDASQRLHLFSDGPGLCDQCANGVQVPISTTIRTRGMRHAFAGGKRFVRLDAEIATHNPRYSCAAIWDGVQERQSLVDAETRDRTRYMTHGGGYWDESNAGDDFWMPDRQDYSQLPGLTCGANGFGVAQMQRFLQHLDIGRRNGTSMQLELTTDRGELELVALRGEAITHGNSGFLEH
jgi:hypothetical protein